jgi:hypothetical protein
MINAIVRTEKRKTFIELLLSLCHFTIDPYQADLEIPLAGV